MIKVRNLEEVTFNPSQAGTMAVATAFATIIVPFTGYLRAIVAKVSVAGAQGGGGTTLPTVNIKQNGSNMFGNATPLTFASAATEATYDAELAGNIAVTKGDVLEFDSTVLYNGSGPTQPVGLSVWLSICRKPPLGGLAVGVAGAFPNTLPG